MWRFDDPGTPVPRVVVDAGIVSLTEELVSDLGMIMVEGVLVHVAPSEKHGLSV